MTLKQRTVRGIKLQIGVSILQKIMTFSTTIILARQLGPSVYGLFAFSLIIVSSFELFKSMGIDTALLRRKDDFPQAADTAFIIIPGLGLFLYGLLNLTAPMIGTMLRNAEMVSVVRVLGLVFVINCFTKVPVLSLERELRFKGISIAEVSAAAAFSATALLLVFRGFGIWTLVFAYIMRTFTYMTLVWIYSGWKPRFRFEKKLALEMFHFGKFVLMTAIIWFLKMNLDHIFVGKLLGATILGYYAVAFNIANFGPEYLGTRINRVIYPAYARLQGNTRELKRAFLKVLRYLCLAAVPLSAGTFLLGGDFVRLAYGEKWLGALPAIKILACIGVGNLIPVATDSIFLTIGRPKLSFWAVLIQVAMFFVFAAPASRWGGLIGIGTLVAAASIISLALQLWWAKRCLQITAAELYESVYPSLAASAVMAAVIIAFRHGYALVASAQFIHAVFIIEAILSVLVYGGALVLINKVLIKEMKEIAFH